MTWQVIQIAEQDVTPMRLYDLAAAHNLLPSNPNQTIDYYRSLASRCEFFEMLDVGDNGSRPGRVGTVVVSNIVRGESADVDLVPIPEFFTCGFQPTIKKALWPVLSRLFADYGVRRLNSFVAVSRPRTKWALVACGFKIEGKMREGVKFAGKRPEDTWVMGMLASDFSEA